MDRKTELIVRVNHELLLFYIAVVLMLTVGVLGGDLVRHLRGIANTDSIDGAYPDDILLLWFDSIINPEFKLFDGSVIDSEPLQLRTGLSHLNMVAGDWRATIFGRGIPGNIDVLSACIRDLHLEGRRWRALRKNKMS